ncbi:Zinc finger ccch domain protein [Thalictrum thalictroides]|uniref:Zinc finger ccch domain protein n=1 Tax=Thalictrum thalictroides TaxID=46969 RepID=A0A7J6X6F5_THATH|nr:Zinc finger ccch domain protein [Thalictrum thalictroides]
MSNSGKRKRGRPAIPNKEEVAEDWCFVCKDGGDLLICDYKQCMKAYHPECVEKAENVLETGQRWNCDWHSCLICNKSSTYRCFVCPNAVCRKCIKLAEFVQVRGKHGFCNDCLYRALLYEENVDVDSNGRKVDFKDRNTYECLFNEYWEIIKQKEGLTSEDVRSANILLKKGGCFRGKMDTGKFFNGEEEDQDFEDVEPCSLMENETKWLPPRKHAKKGKQKRREFMGWGSKSLIEFLKSVGKDSIIPISQYDVRDIILDYIKENKLTHPEKKKKVLCDIKLHSIFSRKSINKNKIFDLLERHFKENMEQSEEDDYSCNSDEKYEDTIMTCKRQTRTSLRRRKDEKEIVLETSRSRFASVTEHNIKLIYLKRTLIEDFLMTPETFDDKVIGSFVRVKTNPSDYFQKNVYQLLQVTGITKARGTENITGEVTLQLSNMKEDIQICMLSDDNFLEEEIEELHQRVKKGLLKRLTIVELEQKARRLHEDRTEHWIKKELILLQNLIDQANEKGWRREYPFHSLSLLQDFRKRILQSFYPSNFENFQVSHMRKYLLFQFKLSRYSCISYTSILINHNMLTCCTFV